MYFNQYMIQQESNMNLSIIVRTNVYIKGSILLKRYLKGNKPALWDLKIP